MGTRITPPTLDELMREMIESQLHSMVDEIGDKKLTELHTMLAYHLGWEGFGAGPEATGKRLRPLLVLLTTSATGGDWRLALPVAAAVELIHNFSLIHDDIEDNSPLRRGRPTIWQTWGIPQAINTGDAMFTLAHLAIFHLEDKIPPTQVIKCARILQQTCLILTQGQYRDMSYQTRDDLSLDDYWIMVEEKTAALFRACTRLGATVTNVNVADEDNYARFGRNLGLAFQVQDDILGIWGNAALTGKSCESDLLEGKKSLPVLYGLTQNGQFAKRWKQGPVEPDEVQPLADLLRAEGANVYAQDWVRRLTIQALQYLDETKPQGEAGNILRGMAQKLVNRKT